LQGDPFKTLFVARVSYDATEKKLKREFEEYGPVKRVRLVTEKDSGNMLSHQALVQHVGLEL
jgi:U1 small nuclear ribonucleoprotein